MSNDYSTPFSSRMKRTARRLILRYGTTMQLKREAVAPMYEAGTQRPYWLDSEGSKTYVKPPATLYTGHATVRKVMDSEVTDGRIRYTDMVFTIIDVPEPNTKDVIIWRGDQYTIIDIAPSVVQSEDIAYLLVVRKM